MRRLLFILFFVWAACWAYAAGPSASAFYQTFTYETGPLVRHAADFAPAGQCMAVRLTERWALTAAHCVQESCKNGCTLRFEFMPGEVYPGAFTTHTEANPAVFVHPDYQAVKTARADMALLKLPEISAWSYYKRARKPGKPDEAVSRKKFLKLLKKNPDAQRNYDALLRPSFSALVAFAERTRRIASPLTVADVKDGKRTILESRHYVDYVSPLGFAYTDNFGVRLGMSGGAVLAQSGELLGVVSGVLRATRTDEIRPGVYGEFETDQFFLFNVFTPPARAFLKQTMGDDFARLVWTGAEPGFVNDMLKDHAAVTHAAEAVDALKTESLMKKATE